jgi:hypothetical protein
MKAVLGDYSWNPFRLLRRRSVSAVGGYEAVLAGEHQRGINGSANGHNAQYKKKWRSSISPMASAETIPLATTGRTGYYNKLSWHVRIAIGAIISFLLTGAIIGLVRRHNGRRGFFDSGLSPPDPHIPSWDREKANNPTYPWMEYPMYVSVLLNRGLSLIRLKTGYLAFTMACEH